MSTITFSSCWYAFKSKFDVSTYLKWIDKMLSNVNQYNLVIYTDETSVSLLTKYAKNSRIKLIIKPDTEFYNYRYQNDWIRNHQINTTLNRKTEWKVNMLWCEKVHFVHETMTQQYFDTDYYGWCDIGYFRDQPDDLTPEQLAKWPSQTKLDNLKKDKIYYACANNYDDYIKALRANVLNKNEKGLPVPPIMVTQVSICGGFYVGHKDMIEWWRDQFDAKLQLYFANNYLVKDDQMIIADCVFSDLSHFQLCRETNPMYNHWFLFQRFFM